MITAEEARKLSGKTADEHMKSLEKLIREAAAKGRRETCIKAAPYAHWLYDEKKLALEDPEAQKTVDALRVNGFKVSLYYKESQFVDIGLMISWEQDLRDADQA